jgi:hypothetical protein
VSLQPRGGEKQAASSPSLHHMGPPKDHQESNSQAVTLTSGRDRYFFLDRFFDLAVSSSTPASASLLPSASGSSTSSPPRARGPRSRPLSWVSARTHRHVSPFVCDGWRPCETLSGPIGEPRD